MSSNIYLHNLNVNDLDKSTLNGVKATKLGAVPRRIAPSIPCQEEAVAHLPQPLQQHLLVVQPISNHQGLQVVPLVLIKVFRGMMGDAKGI